MSKCYPGVETQWKIRVRETNERYVDATVRATSYEKALFMGEQAVKDSTEPFKHSIRVDVKAQLGEPWVHFFLSEPGWYDLHGPGDVIAMERSLGNEFTQEDVDLLRDRINSIGLTVVSSWNGKGCSTVSFRCAGRPNGRDPLTTEQKTIITAPRPWTTDA